MVQNAKAKRAARAAAAAASPTSLSGTATQQFTVEELLAGEMPDLCHPTPSLPMDANVSVAWEADVKKRVRHLRTTGVFGNMLDAILLGKVRDHIEAEKAMHVVRLAEINMAEMWLQAASKSKMKLRRELFQQQSHENFRRLEVRSFQTDYLAIKDRANVIMAYVFPVPERFLDILESSVAKLPARKPPNPGKTLAASEARIPEGVARHYACWAKYSKVRFHNAEYLSERPESESFMEANQGLFSYVGEKLALIAPEQAGLYERMQEYDGYIDAGQGGFNEKRKEEGLNIHNLCGPFNSVAINENQRTDGAVHIDSMDMIGKLNCAIPFGKNWVGAETVLWEIETKVKVPYGYGIFFLGSAIHHNVVNMRGAGGRYSIDLFTDQQSKNVWESGKAEKGRKRNMVTNRMRTAEMKKKELAEEKLKRKEDKKRKRKEEGNETNGKKR